MLMNALSTVEYVEPIKIALILKEAIVVGVKVDSCSYQTKLVKV